jgi:outer membrane protein assembly factor BamB
MSSAGPDPGSMARTEILVVLVALLAGSLGMGAGTHALGLGSTTANDIGRAVATPPVIPSTPFAPSVGWPTYLDNPERTGANLLERTIAPSNVSQLRELWSVPSNGSDFSAPIVVNGTVFFGSWNGYEYAVNAANGSVEWKRYLGTSPCSWGNPMGISSTPAYANGTLYLGGGDGYWYALNATNGSVEWRYFVGLESNGYYDWASALVFRASLYIGVASCIDSPLVFGQLLEVNLTGNHTVSHTFDVVPPGQVGGSIWTTPALDPENNTIWIATGNENPPGYPPYTNAIVALNATSLAVLGHWQVPGVQGSDSDFGSTPTLLTTASGVPEVVATNKDGTAYALNRSNVTSSGWAPTWRLSTGGGFSSGAFDGHTLYLGGSGLYAVDPASGNVSWNTGLSGTITGALSWANGIVYAGAGSEVAALDAANGTVLWSYTFPSGETVDAEPVVADGRLYAAGGDFGSSGNLTAFGLPFTANATVAPASGAAPLRVNFSAQARGGLTPYSFAWDFGDGTTGLGPAPSHVYAVGGNFTAQVWINDSANGTTARAFPITVGPALFNPNLTAVISVSTSEGLAPFTVFLNGSETNGTLPPYNYAWAFGDGAVSSGAQAIHTYPSAGNFTVTLQVQDRANHTANASTVLQSVRPLGVTARAGLPNGTTGQAFQFSANRVGGIAPFTFNWAFGDASSGSMVPNPSHVYVAPGNYTVTLVVTDAARERASSSLLVAVVAASVALHASPSFTYVPGACGPNGLRIQYTANASGGTPPLTDRWAFSDGTTATGAVVLRAYADGLVANLTVNDSRGQTYNASVTLSNPPGSAGAPCVPTSSAPWELVLLVLAAVVVLALVAYALVRRRKGGRDDVRREP